MLSADVEADHNEHNIDTLGSNTEELFFNNMSSKSTVTVGGDRAVLSRIMQIVTSAVRIICADIVSRVLRDFQSNRVLGIKLGQVHPSEADIEYKF